MQEEREREMAVWTQEMEAAMQSANDLRKEVEAAQEEKELIRKEREETERRTGAVILLPSVAIN